MSNCFRVQKNLISFILYAIKQKEINIYVIVIDTLILIYTLIDWKSIFTVKNIFILIVLIYINIVWQLISISRDIKNCFSKGKECFCIDEQNNKFKVFRISKDVADKYQILCIDDNNIAVLVSNEIDDILKKEIKYKIYKLKKQKDLDRYIKTYKDILWLFLSWKWKEISNQNGYFFNDEKLCMGGELFHLKGTNIDLPLTKGYYYNTSLTNGIYDIVLNKAEFKISPPMNINNYTIETLDKSRMSDHIGVSTLAITNDGYTFIIRQNNKTAVNNYRLQPSGSGSVDFKDTYKTNYLSQIIIGAANRELHEETKIPYNIIDKTIITGFYRDLYKAGKPEFCCITFLNKNNIEIEEFIKPNRDENTEEYKKVQFLTSNPQKNIHHTFHIFIKENKKEISVPLYMTYCKAVKYFTKNESNMHKFIKAKNNHSEYIIYKSNNKINQTY